MKNKWNKTYKIVTIVITVISILMGIAFLVQTLRIYAAKNDPLYSRDIVGNHLLQILFVIILWIIAVIAGVVFAFLSHPNDSKLVKTTNIIKLHNLMKLLPELDETDENGQALKKELFKRKIAWYICLALLAVCLLMSSLYLFNVKHFEYNGNPTEQIKNMVLHVLPWIIGGLVVLSIGTIYEEFCAKRAIPYAKSLLSQNGKIEKKVMVESKKKSLALNITRGVIVVAAITLIIVGALTGGADGVLQKAINICTECIGLG